MMTTHTYGGQLTSRLTLHVLMDRDLARGRDMVTVAKAALDGGATVIQLRDKTASTRLMIEEGIALRALTRERGTLLIVNDRIDVALAIEADGAHVGQDDMPVVLARQLLGPERILGVSAATVLEADEAIADGADYLGVGPIYDTISKVDAGRPVGLELLSELASHYSIPLVAIGGITIERTREIIRAGAAGVAVISAVVSADDIRHAAQSVLAAIHSA